MLYSQPKIVVPAIKHTDRQSEVHERVEAVQAVLSPEDLARLFWLSGSPCAGKSTVSSEVAKRLGWNIYHCDYHEDKQRERADPKRHPNWYLYSQLTGDALWLQPVEQHCVHEDRAHNEQLELIAEDLAKILRATEGPLIYDGYASPLILARLLPSNVHAYYLVATEQFQRENYKKRPWIKDVLAKTTDPVQAWQNWMDRDVIGARSLETQLRRVGLEWAAVDDSTDIEATINRVCAHFLKSKSERKSEDTHKSH